MPSAIAQVTSSDSSSRSSSRSGRRNTIWSITPSTNMAGVSTSSPTNGSTPRLLYSV